MSRSFSLVFLLGSLRFVCSCCLIPMCQFLFYRVRFCYYSIEACFSEREEGDGSRWEGRWRGDRRSGGGIIKIYYMREKNLFSIKGKTKNSCV